MNSTKALISAVALVGALSSSAWNQSTSPNFNLVSADWSPKQERTLNALPKSIVWNFASGAFRGGPGRVCDFRFADLRHSGNLSLIVVMDYGATAGCSGTQIFDKTASGFEDASITANPEGSLRDAIKDINHDGNLELVLSGALAEDESQHFECIQEWPMIFAWTGSGYTDVSGQYRGYYNQYLKSLEQELANEPTAAEQTQGQVSGQAAPAQATVLPPVLFQAGSSPAPTAGAFVPVPAAPAASPTAATTPEADYECLRLEVAKTDAFLGIHTDATMSAAIKVSENDDPDKRILATVIFSYIGTKEARADLKTLANDSNPTVAELAKERLKGEPDPGIYEFAEDPVPKRFLPKQ